MYKTYVMHYTPLSERREFILNQLASANIKNFELVTEFDREHLTQEDLSRYNKDHDFHKEVCEISRQPHGFAGLSPYNYQEMSLPSISLNLKHLYAFKNFLKQDLDFGLFLEDDCYFTGPSAAIDVIIKKAPNDWDVIFLGGAFDHGIISPLKAYGNNQQGYLLAAHPATNTTSSIIYNKQSVSKIIPYMEQFCVPIDWQLNYAFHKAELNVYHIYPYICSQGQFRSTAKDD